MCFFLLLDCPPTPCDPHIPGFGQAHFGGSKKNPTNLVESKNSMGQLGRILPHVPPHPPDSQTPGVGDNHGGYNSPWEGGPKFMRIMKFGNPTSVWNQTPAFFEGTMSNGMMESHKTKNINCERNNMRIFFGPCLEICDSFFEKPSFLNPPNFHCPNFGVPE